MHESISRCMMHYAPFDKSRSCQKKDIRTPEDENCEEHFKFTHWNGIHMEDSLSGFLSSAIRRNLAIQGVSQQPVGFKQKIGWGEIRTY